MTNRKKIFKGMFRPPWNEVWGKHVRTAQPDPPQCAMAYCSCGGSIPWQDLKDYWLLGHFDEPVYEDR